MNRSSIKAGIRSVFRRWQASWALGGAILLLMGSAARAVDTVPLAAPATDSAVVTWSLRLQADSPVVYHGAAGADSGAGGLGTGMVYPAPNMIGFLAAIATHALLVDSARSQQKQQQLAAADKVLGPYRPMLDAFTARELFSQAFRHTITPGRVELVDLAQPTTAARSVQAEPVFFLTQDERAILLEASVLVSPGGKAAATAPPMVVRVVSDPRPATPGEDTDPSVRWTPTEAVWLKTQSALLLAHALDLALEAASVQAPADIPFQTFRYLEGRTPRMERGQLLGERCRRIVIRTLRGALMSIPVTSPAVTRADDACLSVVAAH